MPVPTSDPQLYHFGARFYQATQGRFTQLDPSGQDPGYVYTGDNPVNFSDMSDLGFIDFFTQSVAPFFTKSVPKGLSRAIKESGLHQNVVEVAKNAKIVYSGCGASCLASSY